MKVAEVYSKSAYWPATVPDSLWQFGLLAPGTRRDFPFVGIAVSGQFVLAFVAGCALICAFAWRRFSEPSYDVNAAAFRDFKDLSIWNLKDSFSLRRAYAIYCISLIFVYAALAFFGRLIVQLFDELNVSGLQIGVGTIEFDSWQWPLFLALGISGFAPLLNSLVPAENWLRRFSHEVVGIPTRLKEKAVRLKTLIDGAPSDMAPRASSNWVKMLLEPKLNGYFVLAKNLQILLQWSYKEHVEWSDPEIRRKLNEYERNVRDDAELALADFDYLTDAGKIPDSMVAADQDRRKEFEKRLWSNVCLLEELRDRFSVILAIYCEYGSRFEKMKSGALRDSIIEKVVDRRELSATGLPLYWFILVLVAYFLVVKAQWHPLISSVPLSDQTAALTAALETLKVFLLVWLPTSGIAAFVSVAYGPDDGSPGAGRSIAWSTISGALGAVAVASLGMTLIALLYSALPARNVSQMWQSLIGSGAWTGALLYFLLLAPIAAIVYSFVNFVRAPVRVPSFSVIAAFAVGATFVTAIYLGEIVVMTSPGQCTIASSNGVTPVSVWGVPRLRRQDLETCFAYYGTLDLIVIPLSALFSVLGLTPRRPTVAGRSAKLGKAAASGLVVMLAVGLVASSVSEARSKDVVVGFRTDIPPFSYQAPSDQGGKNKPYLGYLADICYEIFDNSEYRLIESAIDSKSRFSAMRQASDAPSDATKVDLLCDAVTIRLDDPERMQAGLFSPIVFVSGVSYLSRSLRTFRDVELGYLVPSTAERVAKEACTLDALRLGTSTKAPFCFTGDRSDCLTQRPAIQTTSEPTKSLSERNSTVPSYVLCPMDDHDKLIAWFCSDSARDKVYVGDREIILGKLAAWKAAGKACDGVRDPFQSFTYEPYALVVSKADPVLFAFVQRRIYELFSHRAGAEALFYKWFPAQTMSEPLAWLFSLNGVMEQDQLLGGKKGFPNIKPHQRLPN
ncbi:hypothetical protein [Rhizobium sp. NZLR11]|uniref:hypothetical protein n=1 Tax=Rhizobium sp. NZLR11 TaxID=2731098 RepID=UPI00287F59DB|nr:hypothetical protein [Rhizobium sp. NZLR11]